MSYINQAQDPRRRIAAIAGVAAIHAALGLGIVVGLTVTGIVPPDDVWDPFTITPNPLPTPPPPEPSKPQAAQKSVITAPLPPLGPTENTAVEQTATNQGTVLAVVDGPLVGPTPKPLEASLFTPRRARPSNNPLSWITTEDYPARELRGEAEGVAAYRLIVGTNGRVSACEVVRSTGTNGLDDATCRHIKSRARFEAATDDTGAKVVGSYTGNVKWEIPD